MQENIKKSLIKGRYINKNSLFDVVFFVEKKIMHNFASQKIYNYFLNFKNYVE